MPHFILDCNENILQQQSAETIMQTVHDSAEATQLFAPGDIKVRIRTFEMYTIGNTKNDFIHIFGHIMQGRTIEQRADLSKQIIMALKALFPNIPVLSINIEEFEKATYCNRNLI